MTSSYARGGARTRPIENTDAGGGPAATRRPAHTHLRRDRPRDRTAGGGASAGGHRAGSSRGDGRGDPDGNGDGDAAPSDRTDPAVGEVRRTYDRIAAHFAKTRAYPWPEVTAFLDRTGDPGPVPLGVDVGCGNGRHAEVLAERADRVVGVDVSRGLLQEARERARERDFAARFRPVQADAAALPVATGAVDLAVYVATLHHLRPRRRRLASLDELARVLGVDGRALVGVWSVSHDRFDAETGFDTTVDWTLPGGERVPRFYHVYDQAEFETDLAASTLRVVESFVSSGNCYAVVESA